MKQSFFTIVSNVALTDVVYKMVLEGDTSAITNCGQFVDLRLPEKYLRRPISVCDYDETTLTLIYKVVGSGTEIMAGLTTFFAMAYILFVNPNILSQAGMEWGAVFLATIIASIIGTLVNLAGNILTPLYVGIAAYYWWFAEKPEQILPEPATQEQPAGLVQ